MDGATLGWRVSEWNLAHRPRYEYRAKLFYTGSLPDIYRDRIRLLKSLLAVSATLNFREIHDRKSFHNESQIAFGFLQGYGENMHAWIDCMRSLRHPEDGLSSFTVPEGAILVLHLDHFAAFSQRQPDLARNILHCIGVVNGYALSMDGMVLLTYYIDA